MKKFKSGLSIALVVVLLMQILPITAFSASLEAKGTYKNFVILGDSLCLGFSTEASSMTDVDTFDVISNIYRAANGHDSSGNESFPYTHCYPTVFAKRMGIDTFQNNQVKNRFTPGDAYDDVYNFGVCANWSADTYKMISDPFYIYPYFQQNYDDTTTFVLPNDFTGERDMVINVPGNPYGVSSAGYDANDPSTWQYAQITNFDDPAFKRKDRTTWVVEPASAIDTIKSVTTETDWVTWEEYYAIRYNKESFTIPAGTEINVVDCFDLVIYPGYYYIGKNCLDEEANLIDTNKDGKLDNKDYYYYSEDAIVDTIWDDVTWTETVVFDPELTAIYGEGILNPQFTRYYYTYIADKIRNGDLVALACGGNDVYHTFMDQYMANGMFNEDGSTNILNTLLYYINYAFQMNMSVGDITGMLADPGMLAMFGIDLGDIGAGMGGMGGMGGAESIIGALAMLTAIINEESINQLLDYYSSENVTAFMESEAIPNYKEYYEKCIQRCLEMMDDDSELILIGHYNPFGIQNYIQMINLGMQNGMFNGLIRDGSVVASTLFGALFGTPEIFSELASLDTAALTSRLATAGEELAALISGNYSDKDITDAVVSLSVPLVVLLMDEALGQTYLEFNGFVEEMAAKYNLAWVDVSDAPCANRFDPHPNAMGHAWIADRLYETVTPTVTASVIPENITNSFGRVTGTKYNGTIIPEGVSGVSDTESQLYCHLGEDLSYLITANPGYCIQAIFVDGEQIRTEEDFILDIPADKNLVDLDRNEYGLLKARYYFDDIKASHSVEVQFGTYTGPDLYVAEILDSQAVHTGTGAYKAGATVTLNAGKKSGYDFVAWQVLKGTVVLDSFYDPQATFVMPAEGVRIRALWEAKGSTPCEDCPVDQFVDTTSAAWYHDGVHYCAETGLMVGTGKGRFEPDTTLSRATVITILYRICGRPEVEDKQIFTDVPTGNWYSKAIAWGSQNGLVAGYGNGKFGPNDPVTREQLAAFVRRCAKYLNNRVNDTVESYEQFEATSVTAWAKDYIKWAEAIDLFDGIPGNPIIANATSTRAEAAMVIYNFCMKYM